MPKPKAAALHPDNHFKRKNSRFPEKFLEKRSSWLEIFFWKKGPFAKKNPEWAISAVPAGDSGSGGRPPGEAPRRRRRSRSRSRSHSGTDSGSDSSRSGRRGRKSLSERQQRRAVGPGVVETMHRAKRALEGAAVTEEVRLRLSAAPSDVQADMRRKIH